MAIEILTGIKLEPSEVFGLHKNEIITHFGDASALYERALEEENRSSLWDYSALAWVEKEAPNMSEYDQHSCVSLISETITGTRQGWGTDDYEKEEDIRDRTVALYNVLADYKCSPLTMAKILSAFILDQYLVTEDRPRPSRI